LSSNLLDNRATAPHARSQPRSGLFPKCNRANTWALGLTPGLGRKAAPRSGSPEAIFNASLTRLKANVCLQPSCRQSTPASRLAQRHRNWRRFKPSASTWSPGMRRTTPQRVREIYHPPALLYVRGNVELLNRHSISVVGSRRLTSYRNQMAERLAKDLATAAW